MNHFLLLLFLEYYFINAELRRRGDNWLTADEVVNSIMAFGQDSGKNFGRTLGKNSMLSLLSPYFTSAIYKYHKLKFACTPNP